MREPKNTVLINGKQAKIYHNKSHSADFTIDKANIDTVTVIDELLKGADSSLKYNEGITAMRAITTLDGFNMRITRISNHVGIIRFYLPTNSVFTFGVVGEKYQKYAVAKSDVNIKALQDLKEKILKKLGKKSENHLNNLPTKTADR